MTEAEQSRRPWRLTRGRLLIGAVSVAGGGLALSWLRPDPEKARPVFRRLRELRQQCAEVLGVPLPHLSIGMTGAFEVAIEEGSTLVRIGTALFGARSSTWRDAPETEGR